jgi:hypothetical protein
MTTTSFQSHLNAGIPGFRASSPAKLRVAGAIGGVSPIVRPVALDRGNVLRIKNGRGTRVHTASGVLWITEENSHEDHVLLPGDAIDLAKTGTAIVFAHRTARIVVEVPAGVTPPHAVEMALADGESGRRIALAEPTPLSLSPVATGIATVIGNAVASIRRMVTTLGSRWRAADANATKTYAPMTYSDGYPSRHERRRMMRGMREVERAVIDEWMLWRM